MPNTPDYLPMLSRGAHRGPSEGACLMEYVSHLAGERFSDQPRCTDPVLAAVARQVNDHTSDAGRPRLALLAPQLADSGRVEPERVPVAAAYCARAALRLDPDNRWLRRVVRRADERAQRMASGRDPGRLRAAAHNRFGSMRILIPLTVRQLILSAGANPGLLADAERDRLLFDLLEGCLQVAGPDHPTVRQHAASQV